MTNSLQAQQIARNCYCKTRNCAGRLISYSDFRAHRRSDQAHPASRDQLPNPAPVNSTDQLADHVSQLTLDPTPARDTTSARGIQDRDTPAGRPARVASALFEELYLLDHQIDEHITTVAQIERDSLVSFVPSIAFSSPLEEQEQWFSTTLQRLATAGFDGDPAVPILKEAMMERVNATLVRIREQMTGRHNCTTGLNQNVFDMGMYANFHLKN